MKPFDLQKALAGDDVVTRNGIKVIRIIHLPEAHNDSKILVLLEGGQVLAMHESGKIEIDIANTYDLRMAPKKVKYYLAVSGLKHSQDCALTTSCAYLERRYAEDTVNLWNQNFPGSTIHEIEIEE